MISAQDVVELQDQVPLVKLDAGIAAYILDIVEATRNAEQLHLGVSPRGAPGADVGLPGLGDPARRDYVIPDDVKSLTIPVCADRVISKTYLHNGDAHSTVRILQQILEQTPAPS